MINCGCPFGDFVARNLFSGKGTFIGLGVYALAMLVICAVFMKVNQTAQPAEAAKNSDVPLKKKSIFSYLVCATLIM